jgi:hypothetical protein
MTGGMSRPKYDTFEGQNRCNAWQHRFAPSSASRIQPECVAMTNCERVRTSSCIREIMASAAALSRMIVHSGVDYRSSGEPKPDIVWVIAPRAPTGTMTRAKGEPSPATNAAPIGFPSAPKVSLSTPISALVRYVP